MYVLDEPSIGLHQRDNDRLLGTLTPCATSATRDRGRARRGRDPRRRPHRRHRPGAGRARRRVVARDAEDDPGKARLADRGQFLRASAHRGARRSRPDPKRALKPAAARAATTSRHVDLERPAGLFTCVTGVSGSGQIDADQRHALPPLPPPVHGARAAGAAGKRSPGLEHCSTRWSTSTSRHRPHAALQPGHLHRPVHADPRAVRRRCPERARGYEPGRFSFNVKRAAAARPARATA